MRVKCWTNVKEETPFETVVSINTVDGSLEEIAVHPSMIQGAQIEVSRIRDQGQSVLVELPQESVRGNWRIWVPGSCLVE